MATFTEDQVATIAARYREGEGLRTLSAEFRTSDDEIKRLLIAAGVPIRPRGRPTDWAAKGDDVTALILSLYEQGLGQKAIAKQAHVRTEVVSRTIAASGLVVRAQHQPKFSPEIEQEITRRHQSGESTKALAAEYGCCTVTVQSIARRNGGVLGPRGNRYRDFSPEEEAEIERLWLAGLSQSAIGERFGAHQATISNVLRKRGAEKEARPAVGERHGMWKGGRTQANGYWSVLLPPDHPFASMGRRGGYVMEHRLVMAEQLGRPLLPTEFVHHIDGNRGNNSPANLQLMRASHAKGQALCCADCGSRNLVPCPLPDG